MAYKRPDSSLWQCRRRNLAGFGDTGVLSTGVKNKRVAERMERTLEELAERALVEPTYRAIVEAVLDRRIDLQTMQQHYADGDIAGLRARLTDPLLADVVAEQLVNHPPGRQMEIAARHLVELAPAGARLSYLRSAKTIEDLCRRSERGEPGKRNKKGEIELRPRLRNSVRRRLLRFISQLLRTQIGKAERDVIFADVHYTAVDDTREVILQPGEISRLLEACDTLHARTPGSFYDELGTIIRLALVTSADRGTLVAGHSADGAKAGLLVRQVQIWADPAPPSPAAPDGGEPTFRGTVFVRDGKNENRPRTVPITDSLARELLAACAGKGPDEPVFRMSYQQLDVRWRRVLEAAELKGVRFKDLRAQTAIYAERAGIPLTLISQHLGHGDESTTRRYQRHSATLTDDHALALSDALGLVATG